MSQLGIKSDDEKMVSTKSDKWQVWKGDEMIEWFQETSSTSSPQSEQSIGEYDESTLVFRPIQLESCGQEDDSDQVDIWDFGATFLADLDSNHVWNDTIERQHFGPLKDLITTGGGANRTNNHSFKTHSLLHPTWCDKCGDFIWGILKEALKCEHCNYTCHARCRDLVTLDCRSPGSSLASSTDFDSIYPQLDGTLGTIPKGLILPPAMSSSTGSDKENGNASTSAENPIFSSKNSFTLPKSFSPVDSIRKEPSAPPESRHTTLRVVERYVKEDTPFEWTDEFKELDLERKIEAYNSIARGMEITLHEDGINFGGHIHVNMNLSRPISVVQGVIPPTVYDVVNTAKSTSKTTSLRTITSFFLPRNTTKVINIDSKTTARKMIVTLLKKFRVADNPRKFALYECEQHTDETTCTLTRKLTRISDDACPLKVVLNWPSPHCGRALVLQENDTGDILWDAFEIPELENFLRILGMEEKQYVFQTQQKYQQYRYHLDAELRQRGHFVPDSEVQPPVQTNPFLDEDFLRNQDEYGTSDSMLFSGTIKNAIMGEDPEYVNLEYLKNQNMDQSTNL
uniref:Ras association domain-containing protein 1 n=1 Tax=Caenorhabditis tropicalis TaxID=1561998 RepID=A0A1I7T0N8_9PELO